MVVVLRKDNEMLKEILKDDFMDHRIVKEKCTRMGCSKLQIKEAKYAEGIKTIQVTGPDDNKCWLWFDPEAIWEKYHA